MKLRSGVLLGMILVAAATRLIPHPYNFTPITAIALFGGARFAGKQTAWLVPFGALLLSDLWLGLYPQIWVVYGSFALIVGIGFWLRKHRSVTSLAGATLVSSLLFFLLTDLGVWAFAGLYPKTVQGLTACYVAAIPFFQNSLLGDLLYTAALFGGLALIETMIPSLREARGIPAAA